MHWEAQYRLSSQSLQCWSLRSSHSATSELAQSEAKGKHSIIERLGSHVRILYYSSQAQTSMVPVQETDLASLPTPPEHIIQWQQVVVVDEL